MRASVARIIGAYGPNQDFDLATGSAITNYRVTATRLNANGTLSATTFITTVGPAVRAVQVTVTAGNYRTSVVAINAVGTSQSSALSNAVAAR